MHYSDMTPDRAELSPGPYYGHHDVLATAGLGAAGDGNRFAVEQLIGILRGTMAGVMRVDAPLGVFTPWGRQVGDVQWEGIEHPEYSLILHPVTQAQLRGAAKAAHGHPVPWVGLLSRRVLPPGTLERQLANTPYDLDEVQGVYLSTDSKPLPTIYFLYWLRRHDDFDRGGGTSIEKVASRLGARLVFPQQVERTKRSRPHPQMPFDVALDVQLSPPAAAEAPTDQSGLGKILAVSGLGETDRSKAALAAGALGVGAFLLWRAMR